MKIPVLRSPRPVYPIAEALLVHGIVVVDTMRTHAQRLAQELRDVLGIEPADSERENADFLLHLSCDVEPVNEYGWMDYYVHSGVCPVDAMDAKELVRTAVRQWGMARKPDYFIARVASDR